MGVVKRSSPPAALKAVISFFNGIQQDHDKALVAIIAFCFVNKRKVQFFMNIDLAPYSLHISSVVFTDVFIGQGCSILNQVTLDSVVVAQGGTRGVDLQLNHRRRDSGILGSGIQLCVGAVVTPVGGRLLGSSRSFCFLSRWFLVCASAASTTKQNAHASRHNLIIRFFIVPYL